MTLDYANQSQAHWGRYSGLYQKEPGRFSRCGRRRIEQGPGRL